jgi:hypothetical protein
MPSTGEALAAYIDRQLALMEKHIKGWKQGERSAATLATAFHRVKLSMPATCAGNASGSSRPCLTVDSHKILVFTMTCTRALGDADSALFGDLLRSFRFHH